MIRHEKLDLFSPLTWHPNPVAKTGMVVKRSKKETPLAKSGTSLNLCVSPFHTAYIAIAAHMPTNTTARRMDIAEACLSESVWVSSEKAN